jgi:hypothetical protein
VFEDLPVTKARNSHTRLLDGKIVLVDGEDGSPRSYHKYCFRYFHISTEQSFNISKIVFKSQLGARKRWNTA